MSEIGQPLFQCLRCHGASSGPGWCDSCLASGFSREWPAPSADERAAGYLMEDGCVDLVRLYGDQRPLADRLEASASYMQRLIDAGYGDMTTGELYRALRETRWADEGEQAAELYEQATGYRPPADET